MADYYPLVSRAVAGLTNNTGDVRRALYERARTALVAQLRSSTPPLSEADITEERLALEEAIRKVEAAAADESREREDLELGEETAAAPDSETPQTGSKTEEDRPARVKEAKPADAVEAKPAAAAPPPEEGPGPSRDQGEHDYHDVLGEAADLGEASSKAARAARGNYNALPDDGADERVSGSAEAPPSNRNKVIGGPAPVPYYDDNDNAYRPAFRSYAGLIRIAAVALLILAVASVGYWQRNTIASLFSGRGQPVQTARDNAPPSTTARPKITDRIGPGAQDQRAGTAPATDVAQKVVLYEEDASDPQGKRYVGSIQWRTETVSPGSGLAPELAIRADVEIPERRIRMTWSLRRNSDPALPASHTIEIMFTVPADFSEGGIANVPGILMKSAEQTRGTPLSGLAVKVTTGFFLIGLSSVETDMQRNLQLLKERSWFDIPIVYNNGKRAILAIEKGSSGEHVFEDALRAWGQ